VYDAKAATGNPEDDVLQRQSLDCRLLSCGSRIAFGLGAVAVRVGVGTPKLGHLRVTPIELRDHEIGL
jgi:hypothetical protein